MPFAMTCTCGARLEIDDKFAGQTITCPDCQQPLETNKPGAAGRRTSGLALASIILALAGAFTVVGTVAAVLLGALALIQIGKKADRLAGRGYALAGILVGIPMTGATILGLVFASTSIELLGLAAITGGVNWTGKLDFNGPPEVYRANEGFAIKRPSEKWGVYKPPASPLDFGIGHTWDDVLLVQPEEDMILLCFAEPMQLHQGIEACKDKALQDFKNRDRDGLFNKSGKGMVQGSSTILHATKREPAKDKVSMIEMRVDKQMGGEDKCFVMRVFKRDGEDQMFVVIGGVRRSQFARLQEQIHEAMDGFRLLPRAVGPDG